MSDKYAPPKGIDALCENAASVSYEKLSEDNVRIFKDRLLDTTGCMFGGAIVKEDNFFTEKLKDWGGKPEGAVFTKDFRLPMPHAVMLNCLYARANDFGNMFFHVHGDRIASHCGETLIPMGLTLADAAGTKGQDFIANNIAAEDLTSRILYTLPVRWPTDMLLVATAAAALASRYYGFDGPTMKTALSYAAANATDPGNAYYDYSQEFKYHNADSARMGIMAAEVAKGGWRGYEDPFFGHWGLVAKQVKDGGLPALYEQAFDKLGEVFFTEESFKRCPGGIPTTSAANCGKAIRRQIIEADGKFDAEKVKQVHVARSSTVRYNYYSNPFVLRNHTNALFSFQFSACCALYHGAVGVDHVQTDAILANPLLYKLTEESTMDVFEDPNGTPLMKVTVEMKDGRVFEAVYHYSASMHEYPTKEFIESKFRAQVAAFGKLPKANEDKIIELASKIETLSDMREYTELLQVK